MTPTVSYNGANQVTWTSVNAAVNNGATAAYVYNALNQRVRTVANGATTEFVFNTAGQRVSEWNGTTLAQLKGHYYWGGKPVAFYTTAAGGGAAAHFEHQDWLGTEWMRTTYNGGVEGSYTSLPWGDGQSTVGSDLDANHYATLDHDTETDTDHAEFRQYSNLQGRWMRPDPYSGSYDASNPQSMNRYVYAANNPLSNIDPSGLDACAYDLGNGNTMVVIAEDGGAVDCPGNGFYITTGATSNISVTFDANGNLSAWDGRNPDGTYDTAVIAYPNSPNSTTNTSTITLAPSNLLQNVLNYLNSHPVTFSVNEIGAAQITYQNSTKTLCVNVGLGASLPPTKAVTIGILNNGNMGNWTKVLSGFGYTFSSSAYGGYQASTNSSGTVGGPTVSLPGVSGSYTYGGCATL